MNFIKKEENIKFDFFPYQPYQAQQKFMEECYKGLKDKDVKVMLMESPTGTGKTLMMLSAAFKLLEEKKEKGLFRIILILLKKMTRWVKRLLKRVKEKCFSKPFQSVLKNQV